MFPGHLDVMSVFCVRALLAQLSTYLLPTRPDVPRHTIRANGEPAGIFRRAVACAPSDFLDLCRDDVCRVLPAHMRMISCVPSLRVPSPSRPRGKLSDQHLRLYLRRFPSCFQDPHGSRRLSPQSVPYMT